MYSFQFIIYLVDGNLYPEREHFSEPSNIPREIEEADEEGKRGFEGLDNESVSDIMDDQEAMMVTRSKVKLHFLSSNVNMFVKC